MEDHRKNVPLAALLVGYRERGTNHITRLSCHRLGPSPLPSETCLSITVCGRDLSACPITSRIRQPNLYQIPVWQCRGASMGYAAFRWRFVNCMGTFVPNPSSHNWLTWTWASNIPGTSPCWSVQADQAWEGGYNLAYTPIEKLAPSWAWFIHPPVSFPFCPSPAHAILFLPLPHAGPTCSGGTLSLNHHTLQVPSLPISSLGSLHSHKVLHGAFAAACMADYAFHQHWPWIGLSQQLVIRRENTITAPQCGTPCHKWLFMPSCIFYFWN